MIEFGLLFVIIACVIGFLVALGVGANDLANIMSTAMGSKAISVRQAVIIAIVFEFAGAFFGGLHVTSTIRNGIIDTIQLAGQPQLLVEGLFATLLAGMFWILLASYFGMPVSITNSVIGALIGFGAIVLGFHAVHWHTVGRIAVSWVSSPLIAGFLSFTLFLLIRRFILAANDPIKNASRYLPVLFFVVGFIMAIVIVVEDLYELGYRPSIRERILIIIGTASCITFLGKWLCDRVLIDKNINLHQRLEHVEKAFAILMAFTACIMVYAHGTNDVAIAVGPVSAIYSIVTSNGDVTMNQPPVFWLILMGCVGVVAGLFIYGHKVIATVGHGITMLTPSRAFAATIASAGTVIISTSIGIPVSATQTLVGGVMGVGMARGIGALNLVVVRNIIFSWVVTVPCTALLSVLFLNILRGIGKFL